MLMKLLLVSSFLHARTHTLLVREKGRKYERIYSSWSSMRPKDSSVLCNVRESVIFTSNTFVFLVLSFQRFCLNVGIHELFLFSQATLSKRRTESEKERSAKRYIFTCFFCQDTIYVWIHLCDVLFPSSQSYHKEIYG